LVDIAIEQGMADQVKNELSDFMLLLAESAELRNFLASPAVPRPTKQAVIEKLILRLGAAKIVRNFLFVVVENGRAALLPQIREEFEAQLRARLGLAQAHVTSAHELSGQEKTDLALVLERLTGKRVETLYSLDPELIGGAVVRIGSVIYDGSVRERLNRLRARLASE
jgi:F-type H+-transporting ATPase subunit delta